MNDEQNEIRASAPELPIPSTNPLFPPFYQPPTQPGYYGGAQHHPFGFNSYFFPGAGCMGGYPQPQMPMMPFQPQQRFEQQQQMVS